MSEFASKSDSHSATLLKDKELLIKQYLELQDLVDRYNEQVYKVCCEIETLNLKIKDAQEEERRASGRATGARTRCAPSQN